MEPLRGGERESARACTHKNAVTTSICSEPAAPAAEPAEDDEPNEAYIYVCAKMYSMQI